jgi:hypothetical protein
MPEIVIEAPRQGISASPFVGFADVRQLDVSSVPGIAKLNTKLVKVSGTTVDAQVNWFVRDPITTGNIWALDSNGVVYSSTDSGVTWAELNIGSTTSAHGNGLWLWEDYLFVARDTALDTYGPLLSGKTVTVTIATPGVFTLTTHGLAANDRVIFSTSGALPTGLTAGTVYFVIAAGLTADEFEVSTAQGGSAVNTSGTQSGTHKVRIMEFGWKTIDSDVLWHPMLTSKNDSKLYGGAGRFIYSLEELTTFNAQDAATFTWTQQALDLPSPYRIKCIEELGNYLMSGTWQGTNTNDVRIADIFSWDRSSPSFGQPVQMNDYGVHAMKNSGNALIVLAGISGGIFKCDGVNAVKIAQLPIDIGASGIQDWYPGSIMTYKEKVFFGCGNTSSPYSGQGVYSLQQTGQGYTLILEHLNSSLTDGTAAPVMANAILPITRNTFILGWRSDATYGIDLASATSYAYGTDYSGYYDSPMYSVGSNLQPYKFGQIEFQLARLLRTGEGIRLAYRKDLADSFTTIRTVAYTDVDAGGILSKNIITNIPNDVVACEQIQFRVSIKGTSTTTPELKRVIVR